MGKTANPKPTLLSDEAPASSPAALVAFVRLLACQAAHDTFASAEPAPASAPDHSKQEETREAQA